MRMLRGTACFDWRDVKAIRWIELLGAMFGGKLRMIGLPRAYNSHLWIHRMFVSPNWKRYTTMREIRKPPLETLSDFGSLCSFETFTFRKSIRQVRVSWSVIQYRRRRQRDGKSYGMCAWHFSSRMAQLTRRLTRNSCSLMNVAQSTETETSNGNLNLIKIDSRRLRLCWFECK